MKQIIFFSILILASSCRSFVDINNSSFSNNSVNFRFLDQKNEFIFISKINAQADNYVYYVQNFRIFLPKRILSWSGSGNEYYFEYENKQLIYLYVEYKNVGVENDWHISDFKQEDIFSMLNEYWHEQGYSDSYLTKNHKNRVTKLFSNGKDKILLYNINERNFNHFSESIKFFQKID